MKKEIFIAICLGLLVGLLITFAIYQNKFKTQTPDDNTQELTNNPPEASPSNTIGQLTLLSPEDEIVQETEELTVAGSTAANSFVVIFVNEEELITSADELGNFSLKIKLEKGSNVIIVHVLNEDGEVTTLERTVIYSTQSLKPDAN